MKGWKEYCAGLGIAQRLQLLPAPVRKELIRGFDPNKISNRGIAAATGISESTVRRIRKGVPREGLAVRSARKSKAPEIESAGNHCG